MAYGLYDLIVPRFKQTLTPMPGQIDKVIAYCEAKKVDPEVLLQARLSPDMHPFRWQVLATLTHTVGALASVDSGEATFVGERPELNSLPALKAAIVDALGKLESVDAAKLNADADKDVAMQAGPNEIKFTAAGYLTSFSLPNYYFHAATAYGILRSSGVDVGKRDFLGPIQLKQ